MAHLSIIIPVFKEPFLNKTVDSILSNAKGDIEIIPVFDGVPPTVFADPRVKPIVLEHVGMRGAINAGILASTGKYLMKSDAHCCFAPGFDKVLTETCAEDWVLIPRRYSLDEVLWDRVENGSIKDYHYITYPKQTQWGNGIFAIEWRKKRLGVKEIDDTMTFQGSCWTVNKDYFMKHIGLLDSVHYSPFGGEQLEIGLKYWLGGGQNKVTQKTWYAHLRKTKHHYNKHLFSTMHKRDGPLQAGHEYLTKHFMNNEEPNMKYQFSWLIEKFWPVPSWPEEREKWVCGKTNS